MDELPIKFEEHLQLTALGINPASVNFNSLTMESDKFICVRDQIGDTTQVVIVDLCDVAHPIRRPISADSAIMNPASKVIALRGKIGPLEQKTLQIFNIDEKMKLKSHVMAEEVVFWKWVSSELIVVVSDRAVYHWASTGDDAPKEMFERLPNLNGFQIIQYKTDLQLRWLLLIGINAQAQGVIGLMQLYSVDRKCSQIVDGQVASFAQLKLDDNQVASTLLCLASKNAQGAKLHIVEVGQPAANNVPYPKKTVDIPFPIDAKDDFPIAMQVSQKYETAYLISKYGFIYIHDIDSGKCIYTNRISDDPIFVTVPHLSTGGIIGVNRKGQVLSVTIDESNIISYIVNVLGDYKLAVRFASRNNLSGAEEFFIKNFESSCQNGNYLEAAKVAAAAPRNVLRTPQVLQKLLQMPVSNQKSPVLQYFAILLEKTQLTVCESLELSRIVLAQGKKQLIEKWLLQEKIECSEELGDFVKDHDPKLALSIYLRANAPKKVILCFAEAGNFPKLFQYAKKVNFVPDYVSVLRTIAKTDANQAGTFALMLLKECETPLDFGSIVDVFVEQNMVQQVTAFLLDALKPDRPEEGALQTRLLEMNLKAAPQVADAILGNEMFSHFDKSYIARLCEQHRLFHRALEHYTDINDVKRLVVQTPLFNLDWLVGYFGKLSCEDSYSCLEAMLSSNLTQNLQPCVRIMTKYWEQLTIKACITLFETFSCFEGLFYFLNAVIPHTQAPEHHFKYIEAACTVNQLKEVERFCQDSSCYDGEKVKNFFKEFKLADHWPFIVVCDKFEFMDDLVRYLLDNDSYNYIETYVQKVNPARLPKIVGKLVDIGFLEEKLQDLIFSVGRGFSYSELIDVVESRGRLNLLLPWLQQVTQGDNTEVAIHNALAKLYIDSDDNVEKFLIENTSYDPLIIGKYCEKRNPLWACVAYERGQFDDDLIRICDENGLFKIEGRYLVKKKDPKLWARVLTESNPHRKTVVNQVVQNISTEPQALDDISVAVRALMAADLPNELIELLERLISTSLEFSKNRNLQNLLLCTAIKTDKSKVLKFMSKLDNYDVADVGNIAVNNGLVEEAFLMYKKFEDNVSAVHILIDHKESLNEAKDFAERCNQPAVWSQLGQAQLKRNLVEESITSFMKAQDFSLYLEVIQKAQKTEVWESLLKYLQVAKTKLKDSFIDSELAYTLAKTNNLPEMEDFILMPNCADILKVGDRCFEDELYEGAKILYASIPNFSRLASTLVRLGDFKSAVDCAKKVKNTKTLKEVCFACLEHEEFRLAHTCGMLIAVDADEFEELVLHYEKHGYFKELIRVLEGALGMERVHMGIFTELAILLAKHQPEKLSEHLELFWSHINIPKAIRATKLAHLWSETVFLYEKYEDYDNAVLIILGHPSEAWKEGRFKELIARVANVELYYKAIQFYLDYKPLLLNDILLTLNPRLDHNRVVDLFLSNKHLRLIKKFLCAVQTLNNRLINEALNALFVEEHDYEALKTSITSFDNINDLGLAQTLQSHILVEFRKISAYLYQKNNKWKHCMNICKENRLFKEAIEYAADSRTSDIVEDLIKWFLERGNMDCFVVCIFQCYDLLYPDVVLELAWRYRVLDVAMPYLIQVVRELGAKIVRLEEEYERRVKEDRSRKDGMEPQLYLVGSQNLRCWSSSCSFKCALNSRKDQMQ